MLASLGSVLVTCSICGFNSFGNFSVIVSTSAVSVQWQNVLVRSLALNKLKLASTFSFFHPHNVAAKDTL